jgi:hypothetical protein
MKSLPEDSSNTQVPGGELGETSGYVKNKIKDSKKGRPLARARKEHWPASLAKVIKKAISISERLTERDQAASVRVLREAKAATHRVFDPTTKQLIEVPDHKTRLAAVTLELAYTEGRPFDPQIKENAHFEDLGAMLNRERSTPEFKRLYGGVVDANSLQSGQNVTNQERPEHVSISETEPTPSAEK